MRSNKVLYLGLVFGLSLGVVSQAALASAIALETARKSFLEAENALAQGKLSLYQALKKRLVQYPLLPYLLFSEYERRIQTLSLSEFQAFMDQYPDSPLAEQLRVHWLQSKAKQENWGAFLKAYQPTEDLSLQCQYLWASLQHPTNPQMILKQISPLWLSGKPFPRSCEAVFSVFEKSGVITRPMIWQRLKLAIQEGNANLARKTARMLKRSEFALVELWLMIHENPYLVSQSKYFSDRHPAYLEMLVDGVSLIAKTKPEAAITIWQKIAHRYPFEERHWGLVVRAIGLAFAFQKHPDAEKWLRKVPAVHTNQAVHEWRIRIALSKEDWPLVLKWVQALPEHLGKTEEWQYWHARGLEMINQRPESQILLSKLSKTRSYYGFLASQQLSKPFELLNYKTPIERTLVLNIAKKSAVLRARELQVLGRFAKAKSEWQFATKQMNDTEKHAAAQLAIKWELPNWAILALSKSTNKDDLSLRFPVIYGQHILQQAQKHTLDPALILAITRQESAFVSHAKSSKGALGLMQVLPSNVQWIAQRKQISVPRQSSIALYEPHTNIQLGSAYLKMLLDQHQNHTVLAAAAYNAGPGRVRKWLPTYDMAADLWIETIPFKETREYVKNVMTYTAIYQEILGKKATLEQHMAYIPSKD